MFSSGREKVDDDDEDDYDATDKELTHCGSHNNGSIIGKVFSESTGGLLVTVYLGDIKVIM